VATAATLVEAALTVMVLFGTSIAVTVVPAGKFGLTMVEPIERPATVVSWTVVAPMPMEAAE
jgi:hypothetical protein